SINFSIISVQNALNAVAEATETHKGTRVYRLSGRLRSSLEYADIGEIMSFGFGDYLADVQRQCLAIHDAIYQVYVTYPVEEKLAS
ncbi:MAG: alpha-E domain-containing protein, partial [Caldilineaceae bacterium]|nr:alpha-E domain-containing protein [Caldilineaceae bacterium]